MRAGFYTEVLNSGKVEAMRSLTVCLSKQIKMFSYLYKLSMQRKTKIHKTHTHTHTMANR